MRYPGHTILYLTCIFLYSPTMNDWDASQVTTMYQLFLNRASFNEINLNVDNSDPQNNGSAPLLSGYTKPLVAVGRTTTRANVIRFGVSDVLPTVLIRSCSKECCTGSPPSKKGLAVCQDRKCLHCMRNGSPWCSANKDCCSNSCQNGTCKAKGTLVLAGNDRVRPSLTVGKS
jgi:hypothetical protein